VAEAAAGPLTLESTTYSSISPPEYTDSVAPPAVAYMPVCADTYENCPASIMQLLELDVVWVWRAQVARVVARAAPMNKRVAGISARIDFEIGIIK
jgi:hypothetical protein